MRKPAFGGPFSSEGENSLKRGMPGWGERIRTSIWRVRNQTLSPVRGGVPKPLFVEFHKLLETFEFREPYQIFRVQSFGEEWAIRRKMSRLCRLGVRSPAEKSVLLLGLTANKSARRTHGFGQDGGESGIRTHGTVRLVDNPLTSKAGMTERTSFAPETTSPERNERDQSPKKIQQNQRSWPSPPAHNGQVACRALSESTTNQLFFGAER